MQTLHYQEFQKVEALIQPYGSADTVLLSTTEMSVRSDEEVMIGFDACYATSTNSEPTYSALERVPSENYTQSFFKNFNLYSPNFQSPKLVLVGRHEPKFRNTEPTYLNQSALPLQIMHRILNRDSFKNYVLIFGCRACAHEYTYACV